MTETRRVHPDGAHYQEESTSLAFGSEGICSRQAIRCGEPSAGIEEIRCHTDESRSFSDRYDRKSFPDCARSASDSSCKPDRDRLPRTPKVGTISLLATRSPPASRPQNHMPFVQIPCPRS